MCLHQKPHTETWNLDHQLIKNRVSEVRGWAFWLEPSSSHVALRRLPLSLLGMVVSCPVCEMAALEQRRWYAGLDSHGFMVPTVSVFLMPRSVSHWELALGHGESMYTMAINQPQLTLPVVAVNHLPPQVQLDSLSEGSTFNGAELWPTVFWYNQEVKKKKWLTKWLFQLVSSDFKQWQSQLDGLA